MGEFRVFPASTAAEAHFPKKIDVYQQNLLCSTVYIKPRLKHYRNAFACCQVRV